MNDPGVRRIVLLVGITNVGKTTVGAILAKKLGSAFFDLDAEVKKKYQVSLDEFERQHPFLDERQTLKAEILKDLVHTCRSDAVIAVTPLAYARFINSLLRKEGVVCIELQDSAEHIFERLVFSDENDVVARDEAYANEHKEYYLKDIKEDITFFRKVFSRVELKYNVDNQDPILVANALVKLIGEEKARCWG